MQHSPLLSFWKLSSILALTSRSYGEKAPASFTDHIGNVRGSSQGRAAAAQRARGARVGARAGDLLRPGTLSRPLFSPWHLATYVLHSLSHNIVKAVL